MWMTSSFRADGRPALFLALSSAVALLLCGSPRQSAAAEIAPDAPRLAPAVVERQPSVGERPAQAASVELKSVAVRRPDETHKKMAGPTFLKQATEPLVIEVQALRPFPPEPRTSSPVIVLNGEKLADTWVILPDKLVAFLPNRARVKEVNRVEVMWIGSEQATLTRKPLTFKRSELPR